MPTRLPRRAARLCVLLAALATCPLRAASGPLCPGDGADGASETRPAYAALDAPPSVAAWRAPSALPDTCRLALDTPAELAIALAGRFGGVASVETLAARLGAVSETRGLRYWSVTSRGWRELVSDAVALSAPVADARRSDFTAEEVLSGRTLYFAQNDTRSWGLNVYSVRVLEWSAERLVVEGDNVSPIRLGPITLFRPHALRSVQFVDREGRDTWAYYGLSLVRADVPEDREGSLVNRQAAFYRFLIGDRADGDPPLAP